MVLPSTPFVKELVRWATGKRLTNRLPKLTLITLSRDALRDLTALPELTSEGGILERQFLQLKEHAIKGHLVGTFDLAGMRMSLQLREEPAVSSGGRALTPNVRNVDHVE